jgi:hypothetical protein
MGHRITTSARGAYGGSISAISEAIVGTVTEVFAQGSTGAEQVEFSASNAEMGWMMPVPITPGGSASTSVKLTSEGMATIFAKFTDKMGNVIAQAEHAIRVVADTSKRPGAAPRRYGFGGSLSGITEGVLGMMTEVVAQAGDGVEQVEFSASNADMGWMMPVNISPGGSTSASVTLSREGTATIFAKFKDAAGNLKGAAEHMIRVIPAAQNRPANPRLGMGGGLSGITEAIVGAVAEIQATAYGETEQVEFSASNADMGWMMPQPIALGGSITASARLTTEGLATIMATFKDKGGNVLGTAQHLITVLADKARRPAQTGPRLGMGGSLSGIAEAIKGTITEVYAQGSGETEQVEFSVSNAEMGWMMPVTISPGGSASASVTLSQEGTATVFANFKDKMGNLLGTAQHLIRVLPDASKSQGPTDMASLMNARAADILNRIGRKP